MTRLERLVLDALECHGPDAAVFDHIKPFVSARRWGVGFGSCYLALHALEARGEVTSRWDEDPIAAARRGGHRRRLYSAVEPKVIR